ncbi:MAG TPA: flagellar hook-associated protein FlgK [Gammaproteobacteria bacterium]|nr:flagellar hook-associated protein FlgK [Gammaproteobacteria bacterium]
MADLLNIGLSALLAQQRALSTTSNNIANANTPGYSRQRVELTQRAAERLGPNYVGTGVEISDVRRVSDDILASQVRSASGSYSRADAFVSMAESLDNLLADSDTGLSKTVQSFVNALQDVANDPSSTSSRQTLLAESRNLVARFDSMDQRLNELGDEVRSRLSTNADKVTSIGKALADINRRIITSGAASGNAPPSDLLDQRDQLLEQLSSLVQVQTAAQRDGTTSVFIGSGQVLVLGADSATLAVTPGNADPLQPQVVLRGLGPDVNVTQFLTGGEIGGALDFNREMLAPARSQLGRIAVGLVDTVNQAHTSGMDAEGQLGGDFFSIAAPQAFANATNTGSGSVAVSITGVAALEPTSYRLTYSGTGYLLQRVDNGATVAMTGSGTAADPFVADGLSIVVSGAPAANDQFYLKPLEGVAGTMQLLVTRPADIAAAAPTRTSAALGNTGTATISAGQVIDAANPNLLSTATIRFIDATTYSVDGAGSFAYTPGSDIDVNGTRVQITGAPAAGDQFVIQSNTGGTGDNRNMQTMIDRLGQSVFNGDVTLQSATASLISDVGSRTAEVTSQRDVQKTVLDQSKARLESVSGVNLDEEAANMLQYQQLYQAAAKMMSVADTLFQTILAAVGR